MKKVVVYGIRNIELRRNISFFLSDEYEIIGYIDTNYTKDAIDREKLIELTDLIDLEFDLIILASFREPILKEMRKILLSIGVKRDKIIEPTIFLQQGAEKCQVDLIADIENNYHEELGLIFGLSYSLWDIRKEKLCVPFFDCSWHGLDLYYNFCEYKYIAAHKSLFNTKIALLIFPYYYFNFDMSRSIYHYKSGEIFSIWRLNDWHNYMLCPNANDYVENYKMFGQKTALFYHSNRFETESQHIYQGADGAAKLDKIWFMQYKETIEENRATFLNFCFEIKATGILPLIIVPPIFLSGVNKISMSAFQNKKQQFYQFVRETETRIGEIPIVDYADIFADQREYFSDLTHLNSVGAEKFTTLINSEISSALTNML